MLARSSYPQEFIDSSRASVNAQVAAYQDLVKAAQGSAGQDGAQLEVALGAFEPRFFNGMVLVLDASFAHRARGMEGKDGNPLNEVRILVNSLLDNDGVLAADKTIKPETSVLKLEAGDPIALSEADFVRLADAYFAEIERKYT